MNNTNEFSELIEISFPQQEEGITWDKRSPHKINYRRNIAKNFSS